MTYSRAYPTIVPTSTDVLDAHRSYVGGGRTNWGRLQSEVGGPIDLAQACHRACVHKWLNRWACRLPYREVDGVGTQASLSAWWQSHHTFVVDIRGTRLARLTDDQMAAAADAFSQLSCARASQRRKIGPTAASKVLMALSPASFPAWDKRIASKCYSARDGAAYQRHLTTCRGWAQLLSDELEHVLDEAAGITIAKLLDEWFYETFTRDLRQDRPAPPEP